MDSNRSHKIVEYKCKNCKHEREIIMTSTTLQFGLLDSDDLASLDCPKCAGINEEQADIKCSDVKRNEFGYPIFRSVLSAEGNNKH